MLKISKYVEASIKINKGDLSPEKITLPKKIVNNNIIIFLSSFNISVRAKNNKTNFEMYDPATFSSKNIPDILL